MGNYHEKALFIRDGMGDTSCSNVLSKRKDTIYIKSNQEIVMTGVGLCSGITGRPSAFVSIYETVTNTRVAQQGIELEAKRSTQYYNLKHPLKLKKNEYYTIHVEVYGAATHTYRNNCDISTNRDVVIQISREMPYQITGGSFSSAIHNIKNLSNSSNVMSLQKSKSNIESASVSLPKNAKLKLQKVKSQQEITIPALSLKRSSSILSVADSEPDDRSTKSTRSTVWKKKERETSLNLNLITGFHFKKPFELGCCSSK